MESNKVYTTVGIKADTPTINGRIYPKEVLEKAISEYNKREINLGPADRQTGQVILKDVAFKVLDVNMNEYDEVNVIIDVLTNTRQGAILQEQLASGTHCLSSLTMGSIDSNGVIQNDLKLLGFTLVPNDEIVEESNS